MDINKFRAWHPGITDKYGSYSNGIAPQMLFETYEGECFAWKHMGQPIHIMQWTGLLDCRGKQIFEGDIVKNGFSGTWIVLPLEQGSFGLLGVCEKYRDSNFLISALNDHVEIIGNIYEKAESI